MQPTDEKRKTARQKVKMAQDAWNTRDPAKGDASINKIDESERRERPEEEQG